MISEDTVIELANKYLKSESKQLIYGIGDDTAVVRLDNKKYQLITADMLIENTHFLLDRITPYYLAWKSLAVNISDIAAMGGVPTFATLSLALKKETQKDWLEDFFRGLSDCAQKYGVTVVGGDTVAAEKVTISINLMGSCSQPVYRHSIKNGDLLFSTGELGRSSLGLDVLLTQQPEYQGLFKKFWIEHCFPQPCLQEANFLRENLDQFSMLDCSDGLYQSCVTLNSINNLGCVLIEPKVSNEFLEICQKLDCSPHNKFIYGGEDYHLIFAVSEEQYSAIRENYESCFGREPVYLGYFTDEFKGIKLKSDNKIIDLDNQGFHHF